MNILKKFICITTALSIICCTNLKTANAEKKTAKAISKKVSTIVKKKKSVPVKKIVVIPAKLEIVDPPAGEYLPVDKVETCVKASNTNSKVQYKVVLTVGKVSKMLYTKSKDGYGPLVDGKKVAWLDIQGFYDFYTGEVYDENDEIIDKEDIGKKYINHYKRIEGKLTIYVRAYGSKKAYDSKAEFEMMVGCL